MSEPMNLASCIKGQLPEDLAAFIRKSGDSAQERQQRLFLVGGVVRDMLLGSCPVDLDLVVEGDAIKLAGEIAPVVKGTVTPHPHFGTARVTWRRRRADIATARSETYARP